MNYKELVEYIDETDNEIRTSPYVKINWNGSDVDLTIYCTCGSKTWLFGDFILYYKCLCGKRYGLGSRINMIELDDELAEVVDEHGIWSEGSVELR